MSDGQDSQAGAKYVRPVDLDNAQRTTFPARFMWGLEAFAWDWLYWNPMKALSPEKASDFAGGLLRKLGKVTSQNRVMVRNLRLAYPEWDEKQVAEVAGGAWENLGRIVGEMPHLPQMRPFLSDRVDVVGVEKLDAINASKKPAVLIGPHMANWEVMSATVANRMTDSEITYRAANNPYIDRRIADVRAAYGVKNFAPKGAGTRELVRALMKGKTIALMNDQKFNQGIAAPFFGHDAMTAPGPTRLALKFKAMLLPFSTVRTGPARYRVTVYDEIPLDYAKAGTPEEDAEILKAVTAINQFVEARVREHPEQWFWMHNRWPKEAWVKAGVM